MSDRTDLPAPDRAWLLGGGWGRGLALVETLSERWGIEPRAGGKVIWFELARPDAQRRPQ